MAHCTMPTVSLLVLVLGLCTTALGSRVVQSYRDPIDGGELRHMAWDATTGHVFVGAVNRVYDFTRDLELSHSTPTGPEPDSIRCPPDPTLPCDDCTGGQPCERTPSPSINQGLAVAGRHLVSCSTLYYGSCIRIRIADFKIIEAVYRPIVSNNPSSVNSSVVMYIAPGVDADSGNLYVATTRSLLGSVQFVDEIPMIASRKLTNFDLARKERDSMTQIQVLPDLKESYLVYFRAGFSHGGYSYFLSVQEAALSSHDHVTRIMRVCQNDAHFYSYVEIPLECTVNGVHYNAVQSAHVAKAGSDLATALGISEDQDVLYAVFAQTGPQSPVATGPSAICVYSMANVELLFVRTIQDCFKGNGKTGPEHLTYPVRCISTNMQVTGNYCGESPNNHPVYGANRSISPTAAYAIPREDIASGILVKREGKHTLAFIGTNVGRLLKVLLVSVTVRELYEDMLVDSEGGIKKDMVFDNDMSHLYLMTAKQVMKVKLSDCETRSSCEVCLATKDPHCGWCADSNTCTTSSQCPQDKYTWLPYGDDCPQVTDVTPSRLAHSVPGEHGVTLTLFTLPDTEDKELRCRLSDLAGNAVDAWAQVNSFRKTIICEPFDTHSLNMQENVFINATLSILIDHKVWVSTPIAIFDCTAYQNCVNCTGSSHPCVWCVLDGCCVPDNAECPNPTPIITGINADLEALLEIAGTAVLTSSQDFAPVGSGKCPRIEPISESDTFMTHSGKSEIFKVMGRSLSIWATRTVNNPDNREWKPKEVQCRFKVPGYFTIPRIIIKSATLTEVKPGTFGSDAYIECDPVTLEYEDEKPFLLYPFDVVWSFGKPLDNPQGIQIKTYKCGEMVEYCGNCLTLDPVYKCGWCSDRCSLETDCDDWLPPAETCSDPQILRFSPQSGPVLGGTLVTVNGINLGKTPADLRGAVYVVGQACTLQDDGFIPTNSFVCLTGAVDSVKEGPLTLTVNDKYSASTTSSYSYVDPLPTEFHPRKGLTAGGTKVTITGEHMDTGNQAVVYVGANQAEVLSRSPGELVFETPAVNGPQTYEIHVSVDRSETVTMEATFTYVSNPAILDVQPKAAIISGGNVVNVTGLRLDAVQDARLVFLAKIATPEGTCVVLDASSMQCHTPDVHHLDVDLVEGSLPVHFGFLLDRVFLAGPNMTEIPTSGVHERFLVYADPIVDVFLEDGAVKAFDPAGNLHMTGTNLNVVDLFHDAVVQVGGQPCPITMVTADRLICQLPAETEHDSKGKAEVEVTLGNYRMHPGYVQYSVGGEDKLPLILGLIFGLVLPILVAMILLIVCLRRQARRGKGKHVLVAVPDSGGDYPESRYVDARDASEEEQIPLKVDVHKDSPDPALEPPLGEYNFSDYILRLLNRIESKRLRQDVAEVLIPRERLDMQEELGKGHFGCVYAANMKDENMENPIRVAVKTLQGDDFPQHHVDAFLKEGVVMKKFEHAHVLRLLGVCIGQQEEPMVVLPYMANGDLRSYVRDKERNFTARQLLQLAQQVAEGMAYLASLNFVHRDLAARNCMIDDSNCVKVADFGLSKDLFDKEYYSVKDRKAKLPVKWMALESLEDFVFTMKSDVWSFGVLVWELMTRGTTPYPDVDVFDLRNYLASGRRLRKPKYCPDNVHKIMLDCWNGIPERRPTFADLVNRLELLLNPPRRRDPAQQNDEPMYINIKESDSSEYLNPISPPSAS